MWHGYRREGYVLAEGREGRVSLLRYRCERDGNTKRFWNTPRRYIANLICDNNLYVNISVTLSALQKFYKDTDVFYVRTLPTRSCPTKEWLVKISPAKLNVLMSEFWCIMDFETNAVSSPTIIYKFSYNWNINIHIQFCCLIQWF